MGRGWKIGEMAKRSGLSVRALHHCDAIGLFRPSARSGSGHRVYSDEEMTTVEKSYTPEQLGYPAKRRVAIGDARIHEVEAEWPILMAEVRAAIDEGVGPGSERARALATRWMGLVREFTRGDPGITKSLGNLLQGCKSSPWHGTRAHARDDGVHSPGVRRGGVPMTRVRGYNRPLTAEAARGATDHPCETSASPRHSSSTATATRRTTWAGSVT